MLVKPTTSSDTMLGCDTFPSGISRTEPASPGLPSQLANDGDQNANLLDARVAGRHFNLSRSARRFGAAVVVASFASVGIGSRAADAGSGSIIPGDGKICFDGTSSAVVNPSYALRNPNPNGPSQVLKATRKQNSAIQDVEPVHGGAATADDQLAGATWVLYDCPEPAGGSKPSKGGKDFACLEAERCLHVYPKDGVFYGTFLRYGVAQITFLVNVGAEGSETPTGTFMPYAEENLSHLSKYTLLSVQKSRAGYFLVDPIYFKGNFGVHGLFRGKNKPKLENGQLVAFVPTGAKTTDGCIVPPVEIVSAWDDFLSEGLIIQISGTR